MKVEEILNTLTTLDEVAIYERQEYDDRVYIKTLFKGVNSFNIKLDEKVLQLDVVMLTIGGNKLFIIAEDNEDET